MWNARICERKGVLNSSEFFDLYQIFLAGNCFGSRKLWLNSHFVELFAERYLRFKSTSDVFKEGARVQCVRTHPFPWPLFFCWNINDFVILLDWEWRKSHWIFFKMDLICLPIEQSGYATDNDSYVSLWPKSSQWEESSVSKKLLHPPPELIHSFFKK